MVDYASTRIIVALGQRPHTSDELAAICGLEGRAGRKYVSKTITRLLHDGYPIRNLNPVGSHGGGLYTFGDLRRFRSRVEALEWLIDAVEIVVELDTMELAASVPAAAR